ncbi:Hypothetical predicted protein [Olea europaea subsp. europaea]|uniref:Uncharacterized protein n=1 Tax=Olea europaea subsp. europaea TaxID=158383 RepID=A0A8S0T9U8_OLEEU|nr:Hypothetical predicted protein [Olea europaea subsp. europaea]
MVCRPRPGRVLATVGMQPKFQAFAGHVWDTSGPRQGQSLFSCNSGQFHGHGVQAMSRMRQGRI